MGHDDVASGYPISTSFRRLTGYQRDPRDRGVTCMQEKYIYIYIYIYCDAPKPRGPLTTRQPAEYS